jgi:radical SAM modification target selenobiotic family peptide
MISVWSDRFFHAGPRRKGQENSVPRFLNTQASNCKEEVMETRELKKFLAGFGIAGLIAGAGLAAASTAQAAGSTG